MNNAILRGILVVIIAISGFMMFTTDSPYPLATLGIAIICFSIIPKPPEEWTNPPVKNLAVFRPLRPVVGQVDQVP